MPVESCTVDGRPGYRAGPTQHCYDYPPGDETARRKAKQQAFTNLYAIQQSQQRRGEKPKMSADKAFVCGGARGLSLADDDSWDGQAAADSIFAYAGWPDAPQPSKAAKGFLAHDTDEPSQKGSYKLPFARVVGGKLVASASGLRAAASRLPQTDGLSPETRTQCRGVIDSYLNKGDGDQKPKMSDLLFEKQFDSEITAPSEIPEAVQAQINRHAGDDVPPQEILVRYACLANDRYDRSHERFPREYLERFAETIGGKSVLPGHDRAALPIGIWLKGEVLRDESGCYNLRVPFYMDRRSPEGRKVQLGIAKQASVSFKAGGRTCDLCDTEYDGLNGCANGHRKGQEYDGRICTVTYSGPLDKVEALEGSLVWLGCQYGAEVTAAKMLDPYGGHEITRTPTAALSPPFLSVPTAGTSSTALGVKIVSVGDPPTTSAVTNPPVPASATGAPQEKVMPEEINVLKAKVAEQEDEIQAKSLEVKALSELAEDGKAYREHLRGEIAKKMSAASAGSAEAAEAEAQTILQTLAGANLETLLAWHKLAQERFDTKFPPSMQAKMLGEGAVPAPARKLDGVPADTTRKFDPRASLRRS